MRASRLLIAAGALVCAAVLVGALRWPEAAMTGWLAGATANPLDANGDGKTDVLINTPSGPMLLINRGFGTFFINADLHKTLVDGAGKPVIAPKARWVCVDVDGDGNDDLVVISDDGKVTAVLNPKAEGKH